MGHVATVRTATQKLSRNFAHPPTMRLFKRSAYRANAVLRRKVIP